MAKSKKRGLGALLSSAPNESNAGVLDIAIDDVSTNPYQPRKSFSEESIDELAETIKQQGLLQPIVVRPSKSGFELVAGERRWRAAKSIGLGKVPALVREVSDKESAAIALIENVQREDLGILEEARAMARLRDEFELTQNEIANTVGRSRSTVTNILRLLTLPDSVLTLVDRGQLDMGHARAVLSLDDNDQERVATKVARDKLSVRQTESLVNKILRGGKIGTGNRNEARSFSDKIQISRSADDCFELSIPRLSKTEAEYVLKRLNVSMEKMKQHFSNVVSGEKED